MSGDVYPDWKKIFFTWIKLCCPEEAGRTAGRRYSFPLLSPPTSGLARMGRRGGAQVDAEFAFLRFLPPTSSLAWMGRWRGALPWRGACLSLFHSPASRRETKRSLVPTPSKTVDQTFPPLMRWGRPTPLRCELNLLVRPCGAGLVNKEIYRAQS